MPSPSTPSPQIGMPSSPANAGETEASRKLRALVRAMARQAAREFVAEYAARAKDARAEAASDAG